jgi:WD40 repeat protein
MRVHELGGNVFLLQFLPDNRRLLVARGDKGRRISFDVLTISDGQRVTLKVPGAKFDTGHQDWEVNSVALQPDGEGCYIACAGKLHAFHTTSGRPYPVPRGVQAHQVVISPDGKRLLTAYRTASKRQLCAATTGPKGTVIWRKPLSPWYANVAGFLPDSKRFVSVDDVVRIWSFDTGEQLAASRTRTVRSRHPRISPDGQELGLLGRSSMYLWNLATLDKPRRISSSSNFGDFRSFAFHPNTTVMAMIHGGPTLVKEYDLPTLKRVRTWKWNLGELRSVAYSPDGNLGAAGSEDGRIVIWDVDESGTIAEPAGKKR